jgi:hypothetical protein
MAKSPKATQEAATLEAATLEAATQEAATLERPVDAEGHVLDEHGLPLSGPVRAARLEELGMSDPALADAEVETPPLPPEPPLNSGGGDA